MTNFYSQYHSKTCKLKVFWFYLEDERIEENNVNTFPTKQKTKIQDNIFETEQIDTISIANSIFPNIINERNEKS